MPETIDVKAVQAGQNLGQKAFGLNIEPVVDTNTSAQHPAMYDCASDEITLFTNGIGKAVQAGADAFQAVTHAVAHEIGHAAEARHFAEDGLFPWKMYVNPSCFIPVEGGRLRANGYTSYFLGLTNSMQDYAIDKLLSRYGIRDQIARMDLKRTTESLNSLRSSSLDAMDRIGLRLQTIINIPLDVSHYSFGDITEDQRKRIVELAEALVGSKKWERGVDLISSREFGDIKGYRNLLVTFLQEFLGVRAIFGKIRRQEFGNLPSFWTADTYEATILQ
jgi:hypothetical protein